MKAGSDCRAVAYAVGLIAAAAFAGLLIVIINAPGVMDALTGLIEQALNPG